MILPNHRRLPVIIFSVKIVRLGSLKWVTRRIFKLLSNFKGAAYTLYIELIFSSTKKQTIILKNYQRMYTLYSKYLFNIMSLQKIFIS
jgi:hypothetical protein